MGKYYIYAIPSLNYHPLDVALVAVNLDKLIIELSIKQRQCCSV